MSKNIGCCIVTGHKRPDAALVNRFRELPVANIDDCMNRTAAVPPEHTPHEQRKAFRSGLHGKGSTGR